MTVIWITRATWTWQQNGQDYSRSPWICPSKQGLSGVVSKDRHCRIEDWDWESFVFCSQGHLYLARADTGIIEVVGVHGMLNVLSGSELEMYLAWALRGEYSDLWM